jgi:hypothetical protein
VSATPNKVHFVGSIALDSVDDVFHEVGTTCGRRLRRVPDGEPGPRRLWINWQWNALRASAFLKEVSPQPPHHTAMPILTVAEGVNPDDITFGELSYAREARASYQDLLAARERGDLPRDVKLQVSLPTPLAVITPYVEAPALPAVLRAYERAMFGEVKRIAEAIPHEDLAIQWDICLEMVLWDGQSSAALPFPDSEKMIVETLTRCLNVVPADIEMGVHLCYGDFDAKHFFDPIDSGKEVELANKITEISNRPVNWIHMPVPIDRTDDEFYAPLAGLELAPETELYLGLIHADGHDQDRVTAAGKVVSDFGVATECGIARQRSPEQVRALIHAHAAVSAEPVA